MKLEAMTLAAAWALTGCAVSIGFTPTNRPPHALTARAPEAVEIHTVVPNDRPFVDVGQFEASIDTVADDRTKVMNELRAAAGKHGCDAIITDAGTASTPVVGPSVDTVYRATCIVYR